MSGEISQSVASDRLSQDQLEQPKKVLPTLRYVSYGDEKESPYLPAIRQLISKDLSEPYSIYVYRYFLYQWGNLCYMALDENDGLIGVIVCKMEPHRGGPMRGYIAMLATRQEYRGMGIASKLVRMAIEKMIADQADEIVLETETDNVPSLRIYENLGFLRTKRLHRYYLNGNTAYRLVLYLKPGIPYKPTSRPDYNSSSIDYSSGYPDADSNGALGGHGMMSEDLFARQAAQMQIDDVVGKRFDVRGILPSVSNVPYYREKMDSVLTQSFPEHHQEDSILPEMD